jgi:outer membrane immunogenic protein
MVRKILMSTVVLFGAMSVAAAADLPTQKGPPVYAPPPPIFTWTGVYIGGQLGYEWGHAGTFVATGPSTGPFPGMNPSGVVGGGHVGYNYQFGQFVAGLEGDVNGAGYGASNTFGGVGYSTSEYINGSVRGRLGVAWDRALIYATGGAAFGDFTNSFGTATGTNSLNTTRVGWTVGGGVEYALDNNWSLRAEYRYTDYGRLNEYSPTALVGAVSQHETDNRVQAGFSYKFDLGGPAPVAAKY